MRDTPIAHVTGCMSSIRIQVRDSPWNYSLYQGRQGDANQSVHRNYKTFLGGAAKSDGLYQYNARQAAVRVCFLSFLLCLFFFIDTLLLCSWAEHTM